MDYARQKGGDITKVYHVKALTLNDVMRVLHIDHIDLLLLDVEGLANDILSTSYDILSKNFIKIIKVDLADYESSADINKLINILRKASYRVTIIENTLYAKK
jgi:hypothetical protein